jgi:hypothetical protein
MTQWETYLRKRARELATPAVRALNDPLGAWAEKRIRLEGRPFTFQGHEYLRAIYDDTAPHVVLSKAAQIGGTTWAILRSLHACLQGLNVIYYFPTRTDVLDFSRSRVGPLLADNPFLAGRMTDTDTVGLKRIGDAFLHFRGMKSTVGMKSVPADLIVFDELDEATPEARALAMERIAHSDYKRVIELSNPSLPGYGIDEQYETSDQRHWILICRECGHRTDLEREFPVKLGQIIPCMFHDGKGIFSRCCSECRCVLDLDHGEWVADFPERPIHGYRVSQLFSSKVRGHEIFQEYYETRFPDRFYNLKIGIPWANLERRVDPATVLALARDVPPPRYPDRGKTVMGVDTGKDLHVVVLRKEYDSKEPPTLIHLEVCRSFEDLDGIVSRFRVWRCVVDGLPETHATRAFAQRNRGRVYLCFFAESQRGGAKWDHKPKMVSVNRTEALDLSREVLRERRVVIARGLPELREFARHVACDAKILEEDEETGAKKYKYIRTGANHYSMAFTYACLAAWRNPGFLRG